MKKYVLLSLLTVLFHIPSSPGYITDNGHFYYQEREGDFTATVDVQGDYKSL